VTALHGDRSRETGDRNQDRLVTTLSLLLLLVLVAVAHHSALGGWWKIDDPQILLHALRNTPVETLFSPARWQTLQTVSFTPLLTISFDVDAALFGPEPFFFYLHQLAATMIATLLLFVVLVPWCGRWVALLTAAAVGVGPAMALGAGSLMIRHYVEGLVLALLAIVAWRRGDPARPSLARDGATALLYLAAVLAKEVYAPLPLLLAAELALARVPLRRSALRLAPSAAVALAYLGWRVAMLGSLGGYGDPTPVRRLPGILWTLFQRFFASSPGPVFVLVPLLTIAAALVLVSRRPRAAAWMVGALLVAVLLPLFGVSGLAEARYGFVPLIAAVSVTGAGLGLLPRRAGLAAGVVLVVLHALAGASLSRTMERAEAASRAEGMYVWRSEAGAPPLLASSPGWYLTGLRDLRRAAGGGEAPAIILSLEGIAAGAVPPEQVIRMDGHPPAPRPLDPGTRQHLRELAARFDPSAPLRVRVAVQRHAVQWELGPDPSAAFTWLTVPEYDEYTIPPEGSLRVPLPSEPQRFRIRRDLPDGTWTLSPVFDLPGEGKAIEWQRGGRGA
jgi:hypothetical protein